MGCYSCFSACRMIICVSSVSVSTPPQQSPKPGPYRNGILLILTTIVIVSILQVEKCRSPGKVPLPDLPPERLEKLLRELKEMDNAEQYVLRANRSGYFPCLKCEGRSVIYLHQGEIWRYGITRKGVHGRYGNQLAAMGLYYKTEYIGSLLVCFKLEKLKIYGYLNHPENLRRAFRLNRRPGNIQDR